MYLCHSYDAGLTCTKMQIILVRFETKSIGQVRNAFSYHIKRSDVTLTEYRILPVFAIKLGRIAFSSLTFETEVKKRLLILFLLRSQKLMMRMQSYLILSRKLVVFCTQSTLRLIKLKH